MTQQSISEFAIVNVFAKLPKSSKLPPTLVTTLTGGGSTRSQSFHDSFEVSAEFLLLAPFVIGDFEGLDDGKGVGSYIETSISLSAGISGTNGVGVVMRRGKSSS